MLWYVRVDSGDSKSADLIPTKTVGYQYRRTERSVKPSIPFRDQPSPRLLGEVALLPGRGDQRGRGLAARHVDATGPAGPGQHGRVRQVGRRWPLAKSARRVTPGEIVAHIPTTVIGVVPGTTADGPVRRVLGLLVATGMPVYRST